MTTNEFRSKNEYEWIIIKALSVKYSGKELCEIVNRHGKTWEQAWRLGIPQDSIVIEIMDYEDNLNYH